MGILLWIILGGVAGWIASLLMGTDARQGLMMNVIVGIVGAVVGGMIMSMLGETGITGFDLYSLLVAVLGAVVLLYVSRLFMRAA
jgi:uncharacterized membrane protein YeaQ/YmgE (transglycosylase-associated protein family)